MARLVVNPGSPAAWQIRLRSGVNTLGRGLANDFRIDDPSVSGAHCEIVVQEGSVLLRDLGSTNGTFLNRAPVKEAILQPGQTVHLGGVEMAFFADAPAVAAAVAIPPPPDPSVGSSPPPPVVSTPVDAGFHNCKHHAKTPARFLCPQCQHYFCDLCVASRHVGPVQHKFCRHCGAECVPVQARVQQVVEKGFFARIPGAFLYPFRGAGVLIVIVGIVIMALLRFGALAMQFGTMRMLIFGIILQIFSGGYLFSYLQCIIHSTAAGDRELPDLPGMSNFVDDILLPFGRLLGLILFCYGPAIGVEIWIISSGQTGGAVVLLAALIFGSLYFPMAFLAVAILDSVTSANPLVIVPSILRVPMEYLVTVLLLAGVFGFRALGDFLVKVIFPEGFGTHSMAVLFAMIGSRMFWAFTNLYLLVVATHILGLLYVSRKGKLGWLDH